jgi:hypothetical protein
MTAQHGWQAKRPDGTWLPVITFGDEAAAWAAVERATGGVTGRFYLERARYTLHRVTIAPTQQAPEPDTRAAVLEESACLCEKLDTEGYSAATRYNARDHAKRIRALIATPAMLSDAGPDTQRLDWFIRNNGVVVYEYRPGRWRVKHGTQGLGEGDTPRAALDAALAANAQQAAGDGA